MRAVLINPPGGEEENMVVTDVPVPHPSPGEALVRVEYGGCNYADTMMRVGSYPHPKGYPLVAGLEIGGTVTAIGEGVDDVSVGDRVAGFSEDAGGFAEFCTIPSERLIHLPDNVGTDTGAAFYIQALTAWHMLHTVSTLKPDDVVLIHAIGGGVGLYLTQLAHQAGATVIGTIGTAGKEKRPLEYGAARVVNRNEEDFVQVVLEMTEGRGVDKVIDSTGGSILDKSFDAIRPLGHVVSFGEAEGRPYPNLWERLVRRSLTFTRFHLGHIDFRSDLSRNAVEAVVSRIADGSLKVPVEGVYPLEKVHEMYDRLLSRQVAGKLLLKVAE
ncbi:quinone oxidoreductase [Nitratireductor aestuarii]|uniref:Quinone oxidoreductase n=1 Tax=Nitratireductor aestuarii TaxID=1735103 RepID=A0A916RUH0_9HYPH|nr:zinc-binding dehydrogenase [Nitratireductor aestuarii]GGA68174.1 quinone oxidoreductase [Nitratireductor aestuarii]